MNPYEELAAAQAEPEVLKALAAGVWVSLERDGQAPVLTPEALGEWLPTCPEGATSRAAEHLQRLYPVPDGYWERMTEAFANYWDRPPPGIAREYRRGPGMAETCRKAAYTWKSLPPEIDSLPTLWASLPMPEPEWQKLLDAVWSIRLPTKMVPLSEIHARWIDEGEERGRHPFTPIVRAWINRPRKVRAEARADPILPAISVREHPARTSGRLAFGGVWQESDGLPDGQLPLIPAPTGPRVPLLEVADWRGGPIMARGRGAPLDLRLLVGACIMTPHGARGAQYRLAVTVRELRDFLFPHGWRRGRDWPRIRKALRRAHGFEIPGRFEWEGGRTVCGWIPFRLAGGAGEGAALGDTVLIDVELPPGSASGPPIDRGELARLGVESAPRFRAYIAAQSVAWLPGKTRVPHPGGGPPRLWTGDRSKYPVLTAANRDRLAYGASDTARTYGRTKADKAWEALPGVDILDRERLTPEGARGWLIVPEDAADAIRKREARDLPNVRKGPT